jgi:hypothetical protein
MLQNTFAANTAAKTPGAGPRASSQSRRAAGPGRCVVIVFAFAPTRVIHASRRCHQIYADLVKGYGGVAWAEGLPALVGGGLAPPEAGVEPSRGSDRSCIWLQKGASLRERVVEALEDEDRVEAREDGLRFRASARASPAARQHSVEHTMIARRRRSRFAVDAPWPRSRGPW